MVTLAPRTRPPGERPESPTPSPPGGPPGGPIGGELPYANRGEEEARPPNLGDEFEAGDRGEHSGTTLEQMREIRRKP